MGWDKGCPRAKVFWEIHGPFIPQSNRRVLNTKQTKETKNLFLRPCHCVANIFSSWLGQGLAANRCQTSAGSARRSRPPQIARVFPLPAIRPRPQSPEDRC